jgi:hypothetical protein
MDNIGETVVSFERGSDSDAASYRLVDAEWEVEIVIVEGSELHDRTDLSMISASGLAFGDGRLFPLIAGAMSTYIRIAGVVVVPRGAYVRLRYGGVEVILNGRRVRARIPWGQRIFARVDTSGRIRSEHGRHIIWPHGVMRLSGEGASPHVTIVENGAVVSFNPADLLREEGV